MPGSLVEEYPLPEIPFEVPTLVCFLLHPLPAASINHDAELSQHPTCAIDPPSELHNRGDELPKASRGALLLASQPAQLKLEVFGLVMTSADPCTNCCLCLEDIHRWRRRVFLHPERGMRVSWIHPAPRAVGVFFCEDRSLFVG